MGVIYRRALLAILETTFIELPASFFFLSSRTSELIKLRLKYTDTEISDGSRCRLEGEQMND